MIAGTNRPSLQSGLAGWASIHSLCAMLLFSTVHADTLVLKDGRTIDGKAFVRRDTMLCVTAGPEGEVLNPEIPVPLASIARYNSEPPAVFATAPAMLKEGNFTKVLEEVDAALKTTETFGDLPGSRWPDLLVLRSHILLAMGDDKQAAEMAVTMRRTKSPELVRNSRTLQALISARKGEFNEAATFVEDAMMDETASSGAVAAAAVARGLVLLNKKQYPEAMKSFLELPVFLPDETALSGMALLGTARAYFGMEDYNRAIETLENLIKSRPGTPEVATAESLLPEWKRKRRVIEEAKEP